MIDIYEVVNKLIGRIEPIGETNADNRSLENLKEMTDLVDKLVSDIDRIASNYKNNHQYSMKEASNVANDFLDSLGIDRE